MYYLIVAEGGTSFTHMVTIGRSASPWGPFESCPRNPILTNMQARVLDIHCTGHGDLVQDHTGKWWMVFLGIRIAQKYMSHLGRETFLAPVEWDEAGWPVVNYGRCITPVSEGPLLPPVKLKQEVETDHFDGSQLEYCWNYLRNPYPEDYSLNDNKGCMTLWGNPYRMDDLDSPALLARRQRYFDCVIAASLEFSPTAENEEAGVIIFLNHHFYYKAVKRVVNGSLHLLLEKKADDFYQVAASVAVEDCPLHFKIAADRLKYTFYYGYSPDGMIELGTASTRFLACEVSGRSFTGTYVGMYASGNGQRSKAPAYFDYFSLKEQS